MWQDKWNTSVECWSAGNSPNKSVSVEAAYSCSSMLCGGEGLSKTMMTATMTTIGDNLFKKAVPLSEVRTNFLSFFLQLRVVLIHKFKWRKQNLTIGKWIQNGKQSEEFRLQLNFFLALATFGVEGSQDCVWTFRSCLNFHAQQDARTNNLTRTRKVPPAH